MFNELGEKNITISDFQAKKIPNSGMTGFID